MNREDKNLSDNSKLSSRFNKKEDITFTAIPKKFVFKKNDFVEDSKPQETQSLEETKNEIPQQGLDIDEIKEKFLEKICSIPVWKEYSEEKKTELVENFLETNFNVRNGELVSQLLASVNGFGIIDYLIKQENVSTVFLNGTNNVYIEINGKILNTEIKPSKNQLKIIIDNIETLSAQKLDYTQSAINLKINNLLIDIIPPNISPNGICVTIKKIVDRDIKSLLNNDFATKEVFDFLISAINSKKNIVISGGINSGKTTLLNAILKDVLPNKRLVLLENRPQINTNEQVIKFVADKSQNINTLIECIEVLIPKFILTDTNASIPQFTEMSGYISSLRANSVDIAISKLINTYITQENLPEKIAKQQVLKNYDYIIQIDTIDGIKRISSIVELTPARTSALSVRNIVTYTEKGYETNFPQPLTSMLADSLISQAGSMSSRFYHQD